MGTEGYSVKMTLHDVIVTLPLRNDLFLLCVYGCFVCIYVCELQMCLVRGEARRTRQIQGLRTESWIPPFPTEIS